MENLKLSFKPGINRESTDYGNSGGWFACDKVRFRRGFPEKIGGWIKFTATPLLGTARSLFGWSTLSGARYYGVGTNLKYYQISGITPNDITPIRRTVTLGNNPFTTGASGSDIITVSDVAHGAVVNDFVTMVGATGFDGIPAGELNTEHQIIGVPNPDSYTIQVTSTATAGGVSGGGAAVEAAYQINTGLDTTVLGDGWGTGTWGSGGWGEASGEITVTDKLRLWSQDNFGEDFLFNVRDGGVYFKQGSAPVSARGAELAAVPGALDVPVVARQILVSDVDRHVIAFGCNDIVSSDQDPLLIRWSDQESVINWQISTTTTAGSLRIDQGSEIMRAIETQNETLVFTNVSLHSLRYVGPPFTFGQTRLGTNISLMGPNAVVSNGSQVYWMGLGVFYVYDGLVREMECDIEDFVFSKINNNQREKIYAGVNRLEGEIVWFIPTEGNENDFYVIYNYKDGIWYYGTLERTAWIDSQFESTPLAASTDGYLYQHEIGSDDGSTEPPSAINAFIESSNFELGNGERFTYIRRHLPDITFRSSTAATPTVTVTLSARSYQGEPYYDNVNGNVVQTAVVPVDTYTTRNDIRLRGRAIQYRIESTGIGVQWRQGLPRLEIRTDGRR